MKELKTKDELEKRIRELEKEAETWRVRYMRLSMTREHLTPLQENQCKQ